MSIPFFKNMLEIIRENKAEMEELNLGGYQLTDNDLLPVIQALSSNSVIRSLNIGSNKLTNNGAQILATQLPDKIISLNISGNNITSEGLKYFAQNSTIRRLLVYSSKIDDRGAIELAKNKTLIELELRGNAITNEGAIALAQHPAIHKLFLSHNQIGNAGANALLRNGRLQILYLGHNNIAELDLERNQSLQVLELGGNPLESRREVIRSLVSYLQLQTLSLCSLGLTDEDVNELLKAIKLTTLYLNCNEITDIGARKIVDRPMLEYSLRLNNLTNIPITRRLNS